MTCEPNRYRGYLRTARTPIASTLTRYRLIGRSCARASTYDSDRLAIIGRIVLMVVGCMGNRQIARALGCSPSTVAHQMAQLGRHCLLVQARELARIEQLDEIVIDGFETFEWSQYFPYHHNVAVDVASGYFLYHTDSPLRRKGRMTGAQAARRRALEAELGKPDPKAIQMGVRELLSAILSKKRPVTIRSDDHPAYPRAIRSRSWGSPAGPGECGIYWQVVASTRRLAYRTGSGITIAAQ